MKATKRYQGIQILRGVASLLVVILHIAGIEKDFPNSKLLSSYFNFGVVGVDIFFVLSGFIMAATTNIYSASYFYIKNFWKRRLLRVYPLYWFYSCLALIVFVLPSSMINSSRWLEADLISSFLLWPTKKLPLLFVGWTLSHEIYFYIIFGLLLFLNFRGRILGLFLWTLFVIIFSQFDHVKSSPIFNLIFSPLTLEFISGVLIYYFFKKNKYFKPYVTIFFSVFVFALIWHYYYRHLVDFTNWQRFFCFGLPSAFLVHGIVCLEEEGSLIFKTRLSAFLEKIGNASYTIYLSHFFVLSVMSRLLFKVIQILEISINEFLLHILVILVLTFTCILYGLLAYSYVEKKMIEWFKP